MDREGIRMHQAIRVILIGGAPGAGKSTLGLAIAQHLGWTSLSVDDLLTAAQAVTSEQSHPGLHVMRRIPSLEYFTESPVAQLVADAEAQHAAAWPLVEAVVRKHARLGPGIVIDGWHLRPSRVSCLGVKEVLAGWIVASPGVLERREESNREWFDQSSDPDRMIRQFLARSLAHNDLIAAEAARLGANVLRQDGSVSVASHTQQVLAWWETHADTR